MDTKQVYHYVYRITNIVENKHYYGKRSSKKLPKSDIGFYYFSSSSDVDFMKDQKNNPQNYKYKVIRTFDTSSAALAFEIKLHAKFDVGVNPSFYNLSKQTAAGWSTSGIPTIHSEETKAKISAAGKGRKHTEKTKAKMSAARKGKPSPNIKFANIYEFGTDKLIAKNVIISRWVVITGYNKGGLIATANADRTKPHTSKNRHYHKGIYARYVSS